MLGWFSRKNRIIRALNDLVPFMVGMREPDDDKHWYSIIRRYRVNYTALKSYENVDADVIDYRTHMMKGSWMFLATKVGFMTNSELLSIQGLQDIQRCVFVVTGVLEVHENHELEYALRVCRQFFGVEWVELLPSHKRHVSPKRMKYYQRMIHTVNGDMSHNDPLLYEEFILNVKRLYHLLTHMVFIPRGIWMHDTVTKEYHFDRKKFYWKFIPSSNDTVCVSRTVNPNLNIELLFAEDVVKGFVDPIDKREYNECLRVYRLQFPYERLEGVWVSDVFDRPNRMRWIFID
jgi:hypothetical protein